MAGEDKDMLEAAVGTKISWKQGKDPTVKVPAPQAPVACFSSAPSVACLAAWPTGSGLAPTEPALHSASLSTSCPRAHPATVLLRSSCVPCHQASAGCLDWQHPHATWCTQPGH